MSIMPQRPATGRSQGVRTVRLVVIVAGLVAIVAGLVLHRLNVSYLGGLALSVAVISGGGA
jgi:uncharacterized membrane protein